MAGMPSAVVPEPPFGTSDGYLPPMPAAGMAPAPVPAWLAELRRDARRRLEAHEPEVWEQLSQQFEASLIQTALEITRGRRIEAAQRLGIGRNTITRKIQELGLPD
jgi:two-component system nitrogen regulation response regulator GlnG